MKRFLTILMTAAMVFAFTGPVYAQSQGKAGASKKTGNRIKVEYVSFPDQYKKYEVYPWETLTIEDFQKSFEAMIKEGRFEQWVRSLTGTAASKNRMVHAFKQQFLLVVSCKPHLCDTSQIIVLFDPAKKHAYGLLADEGKFYFYGQPSQDIRDLLNILLVEEFKAIYSGQS